MREDLLNLYNIFGLNNYYNIMTALAIQLKQELNHPKWKLSPELKQRILPWNSKNKNTEDSRWVLV